MISLLPRQPIATVQMTNSNHGGARRNAGRRNTLQIQAQRTQPLSRFFAPIGQANNNTEAIPMNNIMNNDSGDDGGVAVQVVTMPLTQEELRNAR